MRNIHKNFLPILVFLFILGCSVNNKAKRKVIVPEGEPEWLYSPQSGCSNLFICASGEGATFKEADLHARKALASIFQTNISSKFKFSKHSFTDSEVTEMSEQVNSRIDESVEEVLKASIIKERFQKKEINFSLAALDKNKSSQVLTLDIKKIDDEIRHYYALKNRLYIRKLNILLNQRNLLNEKLVIIQDTGISSPVTFNSINMLKFKSTSGERIKVNYLNDVPELIQKKVEEIFNSLGYKIKKKNDVDFIINLTFNEKEEYLNVEGFKKFSFELKVASKSMSGKKIGSQVINLVSNGRNKNDAYLKIKEELIKEFENKLEQLNLK